MFPLMIPMLIGAAGGSLMNRKNPLKGALLGAGMGAAGGAFAPGLLGGAAGTSTAGTAGLLGVPGAATGAGSQAAMLAAQNQGFGAIGSQMLGQAAGTASGAAVPASVNAMAGAQRLFEAAKKAMEPVGTAMQVAQMVAPEPEPVMPPQPLQTTPLDLSGILSMDQQQQAQDLEEQMRRRSMMGQYVNNLLGVPA